MEAQRRGDMATDIEEIKRRLRSQYPQVEVRQLEVCHPADDDGLWFFSIGSEVEVQLESSTGNCPFLMESSVHSECRTIHSIDEAVEALRRELGLPC